MKTIATQYGPEQSKTLPQSTSGSSVPLSPRSLSISAPVEKSVHTFEVRFSALSASAKYGTARFLIL